MLSHVLLTFLNGISLKRDRKTMAWAPCPVPSRPHRVIAATVLGPPSNSVGQSSPTSQSEPPDRRQKTPLSPHLPAGGETSRSNILGMNYHWDFYLERVLR